jgi:hypothetical protein
VANSLLRGPPHGSLARPPSAARAPTDAGFRSDDTAHRIRHGPPLDRLNTAGRSGRMPPAVSSGVESTLARHIHAEPARRCPPSATPGGIRQEPQPRDRPCWSSEPTSYRPIPVWKRGVEGRRQSRDTAPIDRPLSDDEQTRDGRRIPAAKATDLAAEPGLAVERHQGRLRIGHDRFDFDDEECARRRLPAEDIDRPTIAELVECHLDSRFPPVPLELSHDAIHEGGVGFVEQAIQALAPPSDSDVEVRAQGFADAIQPIEANVPNLSPLDLRHERSREVAPLRDIDLPPPETHPNRADGSAEAEGIHRADRGTGRLSADYLTSGENAPVTATLPAAIRCSSVMCY